MREIKFRAWDGYTMQSQLWIKGDGTQSGATLDLDLANEFQRMVFMQFTGKHDKNGKRIYEGDIVKEPRHGIKFPVEWNRISACWDPVGHVLEESEVLGNIYQNPELLK